MTPQEILSRLRDLFVNTDGTLRRPAPPKKGVAMSAEEMEARSLWEQLVKAQQNYFGEDATKPIQQLLHLFDDIYEHIPARGNRSEEEERFVGQLEDALSDLHTLAMVREASTPRPPLTSAEREQFLHKLQTTKVFQVGFQDASIRSILEVLEGEFRQLADSELWVDIDLRDETLERKISILFEDSSFWDVYHYLAKMGGFEVFVTSYGLGISGQRNRPRSAEELVALGEDYVFANPPWNSAGSAEELLLSITPGTAPPEEIAELLAELSRIYRKAGGSGITFRFEDATIKEGEPA